MNQKIKDYLGVAIIVAVLVISLSAWSFVRSYSQISEPSSSFRSFSVSGEGKVVAIPDVAQFSFSVITEGGKDMAVLQKDNTAKINQAIAFIKQEGVKDADIKTEQYSVQPRYKYYSCPRDGGACPPAEIVGYTIQQSVSVKARDFSKVGDMLGGVVTRGANSVSSLQFTVDDPSEIQNQARAEAITKAKHKAELLAEAGGFSIGRLLSIDEGNGYPVPMYSKTLGMGAGMGGDAAIPTPEIQPGSQDVIVNVTLRYEIR